ncbi:hypothetical protein HPB50_016744 [Hyalomma asiaticum]|uniref:Uncharacterized protein n=1 Tax=Hyalomma asiaticum TaxID=266040 RepID=A0ACB7SVN7_HYAAI|nr:hypothetical protein HPB50_016744 [Hyalomma asiaticum]
MKGEQKKKSEDTQCICGRKRNLRRAPPPEACMRRAYYAGIEVGTRERRRRDDRTSRHSQQRRSVVYLEEVKTKIDSTTCSADVSRQSCGREAWGRRGSLIVELSP